MGRIDWSIQPLDHALASWRDAWHALVCSLGRNPSLLPGWVEVAAVAQGTAADVEVLIGARSDQLVAAIPFRRSVRRQLGLPRRIIDLGAGLVNYHYELVANCSPQEALAALTDQVCRSGGWHVLVASNVPVGSATDIALLDSSYAPAHVRWESRERSPYLPLTGDWAGYLAGRNKAFRYAVRRQQRDIESSGRAQMRWLNAPEQVDELWRAVTHIESRSWKAREGRAITSRAEEEKYNRSLLPYLASSGTLLANVLYIDDMPVAYSLCCAHRGWVGHLKTTFDDAYGKLRVGAFVIQAAVERSFADGHTEFDFLGDAAPHKLEWTSHLREHRDYFVYADGVLSRAVLFARRWRRQDVPVGA